MLFGDRADFAIEADVESELQRPSAVWGHMCVWCRGVALGDINLRHCGLYVAYSAFDWLSANLYSLWADELAGLDNLATWNFLDRLLYGYHEGREIPDDRTVRCDWTVWGRFNFLTNWGEQFDGFKAFILCPPGGPVRILSARFPEHMGRGVQVSPNGVMTAAEAFARWFEREELRLQSAETGCSPPM